MLDQFSRTALLLGNDAMDKLKNSIVAVFGLGGVGSYTVEALCRSGVYGFALFDDDKVCVTNINRQLIATHKTVGKPKVEVMRDRILEINPKAKVEIYRVFYMPENADNFPLEKYSYVVDAIDTVTAKLELISRAKSANVPVISSMGAGNKLNPAAFEVADLSQTTVCPLAKVMRRELKARGINNLKVVYSKEMPIKTKGDDINNCKTNCVCPKDSARTCSVKRQIPGSMAFVPSVAGLIIAGEVVKDLSGINNV